MTWFVLWFAFVLIVPVIVSYQAAKGKRVTVRELGFFIFGLLATGIPFLFVITHR